MMDTGREGMRDAEALDALVEAGFDPGRVAEPLREDAHRVARVLRLLDAGPAFGGRQLRIERVLAEAEPAPVSDAQLDELSDAALESYVMAGFRADRVPSSLSGRAQRLARVSDGLTSLSAKNESWLASTRAKRIEATLDSVRTAEPSTFDFETVRTGRSSFRLSDVVAAAAVLLLVSAVFVPALSAYRGAQQQTACASNLQRAATAFGMYTGDYQSSLPMATAGFGGSWMDVGTTPERSNSANLFTLVRTGHAGLEELACPGNENAPTRVLQRDAVDWGSLEEVSYSYRIMPGRVARVHVLSNRAVVIADRSPVVLRAARGEAVDPEANSPNHGGEGQHLVRLDGSVQWSTTPVVQGDNVWLPRPIEQVIHTVRSRVGLVKGHELPDSPDDAFLGP